MTKLPLISIRFAPFLTAPTQHGFLQLPPVSTMKAESQRLKEQEGTISALKAAIEAVNLAEKISSIPPARTAFSSVGTLLTIVKVCFLPFCNDLLQAHI